jgi:tRNA(adenine34) deaminase
MSPKEDLPLKGTPSQSDEDLRFMREALRQASQALEEGEVPIGAVVVWNGKVIGRGYNQVEKLNDSTAHAEMIAMTAAFNQVGSKYLNEATLYVTIEPCLMCSGAMYWSKLGRIVFGAFDDKNGYRKFTGDKSPFHPKALMTSGVLADECSQLVKDFFIARR